jgi:uncharacterized protein
VECSLHHKPWVTDGPESNLFGLEPNFGCCTANFHQGWPKFANSLFLVSGQQSSDEQDGLVAAVYAPCEALVNLRGTPVHLMEETDYPFGSSIRISVAPLTPLSFPLQLRIPAWAAGATVAVNGRPIDSPAPASFAHIDRTWKAGDRVEIVFPMKPFTSRWYNDSIAIERGPLVFSYGIGESWLKLRDRGLTADWQVYPDSQWNYALAVDTEAPARSIAVIEDRVGEAPFTRRHTPVQLRVRAHKLIGWYAEDGVADPLPQSPLTSDQPEETITLIPYAAAKLRITAFPQCRA